MLSRYRHISFDLDGTLVHTVPEYRYAVVPAVVNALGGVIADRRVIDRFWFEGNRDEVIRTQFGLDPALFWPLFKKNDTPDGRAAHTWAYGDAEPALRELKARGKLISIVTGAPHWIAAMEITKLNGAPHDFYISITDSEFSEKPDPGGLHHVLRSLAVLPEETLYIGNSSEDARFARNAGVDFVYLERKEHEFDRGERVLATVHSLDDLFSLPMIR